MTDNARPSRDPANDDSLAGVLSQVFRKLLQQTDNCIPATVLAFDRDTNRATVQPLIALLTTEGTTLPRAQVASVPVLQIGGGNLVLNFPLKPGDFGWLHASDRDISLFLQDYRAHGAPNTVRMHSFQDGMFIPDVMRGMTIAGEDADAVVLQTKDGNARVSVNATRVKLAFGAKSVTVDASGTTIAGGLVVDGITFGTHAHGGVQPGSGDTGGPHN